ncbi:exodeoxyribonuclease V subunit alpha [Motiliproteus sediminis]|uniref:exodeoxyribonuclease V subunit alpha n=1 Tax=Motiliproteus sediminis TaxID=1468178 RepID=UPI001AEFCC81|nr:exodeoxyribonuclease V subunit alpha [Motiliproteus sediminis]
MSSLENLASLDSDQCLARYAELEAIDFFLARELQTQLGGERPERFMLWLALHWALRQGHSCLDLAAVAGQTLWAGEGRDSVPRPGYRFAELTALQAQLSDLELGPEANQLVVRQQNRLYLRRYWLFEQELAQALNQRLAPLALSADQQAAAAQTIRQLFPHCPAASGQAVSQPQASAAIDWQAVAVANAVERRFCVLSGGPGTGKTYTVARMLATLQAVAAGGLRIMMAAPTGKAKQRLQESIAAAKAQLAHTGIDAALLAAIPEQAHTLHGLLGVRPNSTALRHDAANPLAVDLLLIDEASMVDLPMMTRLLRALPGEARLVLVGDANQLPSIAVGSVLSDLAPLPHQGYSATAAEAIARYCGYRVPPAAATPPQDHVCLLRHSHRFDGSGGIGQLAEATIALDADSSWPLLQSAVSSAPATDSGQLGYLPPASLERWLDAAVEHYYRPIASAPDLANAFRRLAAFRVLVPTRVGDWGVEALNLRIEAQLAHSGAAIRSGHHYHGRPIMITRNHPGLGVFNGDVGLVWRNDRGELDACFEQADGIRRLNLGLLPEVEPVYAMTIHKTQGSEFGHVALLLSDHAARLLSPELIYTGITRAKTRCVVATSERLWRDALAQRAERWSGLAEALREPR